MSEGPPPQKPPETPDEIRELARQLANIRSSHSHRAARSIQNLKPSTSLEDQDRGQNIRLKKIYAIGLLSGLAAQLLIADAAFWFYMALGKHWNLSPAVIDIWLGATLVEVVGIVLVVTQHLFPAATARRSDSR